MTWLSYFREGCYIAIYNKTHVFGLPSRSWHRAPKTLGISWGMKVSWLQTPFSYTKVYFNEETFGKHLTNSGWLSGNQPCNWRAGTFGPTPCSLGRREGLEVDSITSSQWFNQSCLCNKASIKSHKDRFRVLLSLWACGVSGRMALPEKAWKLHILSHIACPMHLFHLAVPELYPFITNYNQVCEMFLWVPWITLAN